VEILEGGRTFKRWGLVGNLMPLGMCSLTLPPGHHEMTSSHLDELTHHRPKSNRATNHGLKTLSCEPTQNFLPYHLAILGILLSNNSMGG
jgi:hypothetical protein